LRRWCCWPNGPPAGRMSDLRAAVNKGEHTVVAPSTASGERVDVFLAAALVELLGTAAGVTRSQVQRMLRQGLVRDGDGGVVSRPSSRVRAGQVLYVRLPPPEISAAIPEPIQLEIVYEDAYLVVVNKPRGMVVHPAAGHASGTLVNALLAHCPELATASGDLLRPGIVHRLDRDTTGLIVAAKDAATRLAMQEIIKKRHFAKTYLALVRGVPSTDHGEVAGNIGRSAKDRKRMAVLADGGRVALTRWRTLGTGRGFALLEVKPHTGRTHQIRVHLAHIGHPVAGDPVYGPRKAATPGGLTGQALHAWRLEFIHPRTGAALILQAPLPDDLRQALDELGIAAPGA